MSKLGMFICWQRGFRLQKIKEVFPSVPEHQLLIMFTDVVNEYFASGCTLFKELKLVDFADLPEYFHREAGKKAAEGFPERLKEYEKRFQKRETFLTQEFLNRQYTI